MEEKLWNLLYNLEDYLEYDETKMGKRLGLFINELQKCKVIIKTMNTKHKVTKPDFDLDNYINWDKIAKDYSLESGDISLHDTLALESIFYKFIKTNKQ